jgi:hypothetical protein
MLPAFVVIQSTRAFELFVNPGGAILRPPAIPFCRHPWRLSTRMPTDKRSIDGGQVDFRGRQCQHAAVTAEEIIRGFYGGKPNAERSS